jgi:autotransporter-associated beta strand protein
LDKTTSGEATLTGELLYTGDTSVTDGKLTVTNLTVSPNVSVTGNGELVAASITATSLTIGGSRAAASAPVPEPGTLVLLATAGLGVLFALRQRK